MPSVFTGSGVAVLTDQAHLGRLALHHVHALLRLDTASQPSRVTPTIAWQSTPDGVTEHATLESGLVKRLASTVFAESP